MTIHDQINDGLHNIQVQIFREYLEMKFSALSEETWRAQWHADIEFEVWRSIWNGSGSIVTTANERHKLVHAALICNGWPTMIDGEVMFVSLIEWAQMYENWLIRMKTV